MDALIPLTSTEHNKRLLSAFRALMLAEAVGLGGSGAEYDTAMGALANTSASFQPYVAARRRLAVCYAEARQQLTECPNQAATDRLYNELLTSAAGFRQLEQALPYPVKFGPSRAALRCNEAIASILKLVLVSSRPVMDEAQQAPRKRRRVETATSSSECVSNLFALMRYRRDASPSTAGPFCGQIAKLVHEKIDIHNPTILRGFLDLVGKPTLCPLPCYIFGPRRSVRVEVCAEVLQGTCQKTCGCLHLKVRGVLMGLPQQRRLRRATLRRWHCTRVAISSSPASEAHSVKDGEAFFDHWTVSRRPQEDECNWSSTDFVSRRILPVGVARACDAVLSVEVFICDVTGVAFASGRYSAATCHDTP